ncbi:DinI-like family protein [Atlantibacter hermannii]|uniref:DinI-like family protein n=1 Tax=Atlantibacter hermannii TaxID=565 RepID=UPI0028B0BBEE|nr:DinI-like family protein [Atlantibacter hermannii]EDV0343391.1 DinI family protein [Salmonella enterica subsp. enterica serovar Minnesota]MDW4578414.1 DinI-like family protein [Atlantibacter hermannii]
MRLNIVLDKEQKLSPAVINSFEAELTSQIHKSYPATKISIRKGTTTGIELTGFPLESDREKISSIIQSVWEDDSWV